MDETTMQQMGSAQQLFASINEMMREQQQFMAQTAELQRQMAATLQQQQQQPSAQPQSTSEPDNREYRAEGIKMPTFAGTKEDDVDDYMFSAKLYFKSKNIKYEGAAPQQRPLSLLVANLKGPAAAWYRDYVSHDGNFLQSVTQFEQLLTAEFTAPDRQEHLRDQLLRLHQKNFSCLEDYVSAFRGIICKVQDMSAIDKVMHFQKGLLVEIRQEVKLRQSRNTTDTISFALMYDRTHSATIRKDGRGYMSRVTKVNQHSQQSRLRGEEPTPMEIGSSLFVSSDECLRQNLCFYCKESGHRLVNCRKRSTRNMSRGPPRPVQVSTSFRTHQSAFRRLVDTDDDDDDDAEDEEVLESMRLNMVSTSAPTRELLRFDGTMNGQNARVLIDSDAQRNIVRLGLAQHHVGTAKVTAERFDGSTTPARTASRYMETMIFDGMELANASLIEWEVSSTQDVILGHPWLVQFNPVINWKTGKMTCGRSTPVVEGWEAHIPAPSTIDTTAQRLFAELLDANPTRSRLEAWQKAVPLEHSQVPQSSVVAATSGPTSHGIDGAGTLQTVNDFDLKSMVDNDGYIEVYQLSIKTAPKWKSVPQLIQPVIVEFADVFPAELPPELPPSCSIEHEVVLKPGAKPSNRAPFRLSKIEQEVLDIFVADLLIRNWIQVSDSPWVSNIFGVPKKDPVTGKFPSRLESLHPITPICLSDG